MSPDGGTKSRHDRQLVMSEIGECGQAALCAAPVLMAGAGGLGSPALCCLAVAGGRVGMDDGNG